MVRFLAWAIAILLLGAGTAVITTNAYDPNTCAYSGTHCPNDWRLGHHAPLYGP